MSIEFSAVCPEQPSFEAIGRLAELLVGLALGAQVPVEAHAGERGTEFRWGSAAGTFLTVAAPGAHEFAEAYVLTADDRDRTPESRLLALVVVLVGAVVSGGRLLDEDGMLRHAGPYEFAAALLAGGPDSPSEVLARVMNSDREHPS